MENFYTIKELAAKLKISVSTIRRMIRSGELEVVRIGPQQQVRVPEAAVRRLCSTTLSTGAESSTHRRVPEYPATVPENLTPEEVILPIVQGFTNKEIAEHLHINVETVRWHLKQIYEKLHVHGSTKVALKFLGMKQKGK